MPPSLQRPHTGRNSLTAQLQGTRCILNPDPSGLQSDDRGSSSDSGESGGHMAVCGFISHRCLPLGVWCSFLLCVLFCPL